MLKNSSNGSRLRSSGSNHCKNLAVMVAKTNGGKSHMLSPRKIIAPQWAVYMHIPDVSIIYFHSSPFALKSNGCDSRGCLAGQFIIKKITED